jgi:uncharacterized protein DUF1573
MRWLRILGVVAFAICAISATVWSARYAPWVARSQSEPSSPTTVRRIQAAKDVKNLNAGIMPESLDTSAMGPVETPPQVAQQAPYPKVATNERTGYDFGTMMVNTEGHHTWRIENKGDGQLLLAKGPVECSCLVSKLSTREVPPGGFAELELTWKPRGPDSEFRKSAVFFTNDPKWNLLRLTAYGRVPPPAVIAPGKWVAGVVTDEREGKVVGTLTSEVYDQFKIVKVEPTDPNVHVVFKPIANDVLKRSGIRGGYEFTATVGKGIKLGQWRSLLRIFTTIKDANPIEVELAAQRTGPVKFLPAIPMTGSAHFDSEKLLLNLERFPRERGSKAAVPAIITAMKDEFRILKVSSPSYPFLKVSLEREEAIAVGGAQGIRFVFEIPPYAPAATHMVRDPIHVSVTTNHPSIHELNFAVAFVAN